MHFRQVALGLVTALFTLISTTANAADAPSSFFDGKDLTGWQGLPQLWKAKDGAIVGSTYPDGGKFNTFLCSEKKYKDFELHFQVKLTGKGWSGNSGVQIRSEVIDRRKFVVKGPQCDMGDAYWGSLYGERFGGKNGGGAMMQGGDPKVVSKLKKDDFIDYYIKCVGKHVTIKLIGEITVDRDFPTLPAEGIIAWQIHAGGPMEVIFKNIQFKDLSAK